MILGCIADDFTGASDLANTLAKGGMATTQFVGIPSQNAAPDCEAGIVSLKIRSVPVEEAVSAARHAFEWLRKQGCGHYFFKYCSTFDSTPAGNIGPVAEMLLDALNAPFAVVCPAFPTNGRTIYQGHLFVHDRLLSQSGMENHPLTPMTDPDIRRWLSHQTEISVGHVSHSTVDRGADAIKQALAHEAGSGRRLVVVDAIDDEDLLAIGTAAVDSLLITGGSGVALGLPAIFRSLGLLKGHESIWPAISGHSVVLSGSCSQQSRLQVDAYLKHHPGTFLSSGDVMTRKSLVGEIAAWALKTAARQPIVYSTSHPDAVAGAQARYGQKVLADAVEGFFAELARELAGRGFSRFVIGGGETSGAVVQGLGLEALSIGPEIDPGVPAMTSKRNGSPFGLALKSGNFGALDFYAKAIAVLEGKAKGASP